MLVHRDWLLTPQRAAVHVPSATAVIADLHVGYAQARCRGGEAIPDGGLDETIAALGSLANRPDVRRLVIAGDLVEDRAGLPLLAELFAWLRGTGIELLGIVPGNHDRDLHTLAETLPLYPDGILLGGWRIVHGDGALDRPPLVQGHHHPCLRWGGGISAPCFLVAKNHLVLPAFSADAAGVNVVIDRRWARYRCCVPTAEDVLDFGVLGRLRQCGENARGRAMFRPSSGVERRGQAGYQ